MIVKSTGLNDQALDGDHPGTLRHGELSEGGFPVINS